jgi:hypothetical protein
MPCHAHAALCHGLEKSLSELHGHGMACVNQTWLHCVNQMGKTHSKPFRGMAWERCGMCELALRETTKYFCQDSHYLRYSTEHGKSHI